jgi:hypothetical protein
MVQLNTRLLSAKTEKIGIFDLYAACARKNSIIQKSYTYSAVFYCILQDNYTFLVAQTLTIICMIFPKKKYVREGGGRIPLEFFKIMSEKNLTKYFEKWNSQSSHSKIFFPWALPLKYKIKPNIPFNFSVVFVE